MHDEFVFHHGHHRVIISVAIFAKKTGEIPLNIQDLTKEITMML